MQQHQNQMDELGGLMGRTISIYDNWAKKIGLNYNSLAVLYCLVVGGEQTQKHICQVWQLPKQTVFSVCKQLKEQGLIDMQTSSHDKREKIVFLTEQGIAFATPKIHALQQLEQQSFDKFGQDKSERMLADFRQFVDILETNLL